MLNLYDYIANNHRCQKLKTDELLITKLSYPHGGRNQQIWSPYNCFGYVVQGTCTMTSASKVITLGPGNAYFLKKRESISQQSCEDNLSVLHIFVPDEFIRVVVEHNQVTSLNIDVPPHQSSIYSIHMDEIFSTFFQSTLSYFTLSSPPPECLLVLKVKELIIDILYSENNLALARYFKQLSREADISLSHIMQENFTFHMSLEELARLCGRSLSAFKRDFARLYGIPPGKWLTQKRLAYGKHLLETTFKDINEIALESGFENTSHFIRIFKQQFGSTPHKYKVTSHSLIQA